MYTPLTHILTTWYGRHASVYKDSIFKNYLKKSWKSNIGCRRKQNDSYFFRHATLFEFQLQTIDARFISL